MNRFGAAMGGFALGSIVTYVVIKYLIDEKDKESKKQASRQEPAAKLRSPVAPSSTPLQKPLSAYAATVEQVGFLTDIMAQLWSHVAVVGADMIRATVQPTLDGLSAPASGLHFTKINLGNVPIRMDNIVVHELKDGAVQFDLDFIWVTDCEIQLKGDYVGQFGIRAIELKGRMSFLLKPLTTKSSVVVSAIQYAFINPPVLELDFSGLAAIADYNFFEKKIKAILQESLSVVVLPNRMMYKMDAACSFFDIYEPPVGIARVSLLNGRGFQVEKKSLSKHDVPDVYCKISLGATKWKTNVVKDSATPVWKEDEQADFLVADYDQILTVHAWDEDGGLLDADDDLGQCHVTVGEMLLAGKTKELEILQDDKRTGAFVKLHCEVCRLTTDLGSFETKSGPHNLCGLLTILVTQAFGIPLSKEKASSFVKITCRDAEFVTSVVTDYPGVDALNPIFDSAFHLLLITDMVCNGDCSVTFDLVNESPSTALGSTTVTQSDLMASTNKTITERREVGDKGASLEFRVSLHGIAQTKKNSATQPPQICVTAPDPDEQPANIATALASADVVDTIRITVVKGHGFKIQKRRGFRKADIPDVYCKIKLGSSPKVWRTSTVKDSTEPEWNDSTVYTFSNHKQIVDIDVWDEDKGTNDPDDFIGNARVTVGELLLAGGMMDVELKLKGAATGAFITLRAEMVASPE